MRLRLRLAACSALGFGLAALALSAVAGIEKAPLPGDLRMARYTQGSTVLEAIAPAVNALGDWRWAPLLATAVFALLTATATGRRTLAGVACALIPFVVMAVLWLGSSGLKEAVRSPRPNGADGLYVDYVRSDYGFPSGHVYGDVLTYGYIAIAVAALLPRWAAAPVQGLCAAIIVLAGGARVSVGAHWPSDVLGGYLWGAVALSLVIATGDLLARYGTGDQGRAS